MVFLNPNFLWGIFLIAIPILLHLFELRKSRKLKFSNVRFLQEISFKSLPKKKLKKRLILLSRLLALVFLIITFANPYIPDPHSLQNPHSQTESLLIIDNSLSMEKIIGEVSYWEEAKKKAGIMAEQLQSGYFFNNEYRQSQQFNQVNEYWEKANEMALSPYFFDFDSKNINSLHLYIFSDFQHHFTQSILKKVEKHKNKNWILFPIQVAQENSVFVDTLWIENKFLGSEESINLRVILRNEGEEKAENIQVKLLNENRQISSVSTQIASKDKVELVFQIQNTVSGKCVIEIDESTVSFDNTFYFFVPKYKKPIITILSDSANNHLFEVFQNDQLFTLQIYESHQNINFTKLFESDLVIFYAFDKLPNWFELSRFKQDLVIIPSPQIDLKNYNEKLKSTIARRPEKMEMTLSLQSLAHPFYKNMVNTFDKTTSLPQVDIYYEFQGMGNKILFGNQKYLTQTSHNAHALYWFDGGIDKLQNHALFLPLMYRMAEHSIGSSQDLYHYLNLATLSLKKITTKTTQDILKLTKEQVTYVPEVSETPTEIYLNLPLQLIEPGHYQLMKGEDTLTTLALNIPKVESLEDTHSIQDLQRIFEKYPNVMIPEIKNVGVDSKWVAGIGNQISLWKYALLMVLVFLFCETLLHRWMK